MSIDIGATFGDGKGGGINVGAGTNSACEADNVVNISGGASQSASATSTPPACKSCFIYSNILWVDPNGTDATAVTGDIFKPWKTIAAAENAAQSEELIYVMPGTYTETLGKDGVQYYLSEGVTITGSFTDGGNDISFSVHGEGEITNSNITVIQTGNSTISFYDVKITSTGNNAVVSQTDGLLKFIGSNIVNTNSGSSAHGILTTVTSTTYNVLLKDMSIVLSSSSAESISASNAFVVLCMTDIGGTNSFNSNVTNYHPGTFLYVEPLLSV